MTTKAIINGIASYLPDRILSNDDLSKMVETSDEWILARTGIRERRIAAPEEFPSNMGIKAAKKLLQQTNTDAETIDLILVTTMTPDYLCPSTAALIQGGIHATQAGACDLGAACSGYIYGLATSKAFIEAKIYRKILLIASEKNSAFVDYSDRTTCILFGDGASATLITSESPGLEIGAIDLAASGNEAHLLTIPGTGSRKGAQAFLEMNGKEIFKHAVRRMVESSLKCLKATNHTIEEIKWLVPHQANIRIIEALAKRLDVDLSRVAITIDRFANTSAATIPITLDLLMQRGEIEKDDLLLLSAIGGGLTWASATLTAI